MAPLGEQREIVDRIEKAFSWIDRLASEANSARKLTDHLDQAVLAKAFRGELVPQDPNHAPRAHPHGAAGGERAPPSKRGAEGVPTRTEQSCTRQGVERKMRRISQSDAPWLWYSLCRNARGYQIP